MISLLAVYLASRRATKKLSFGWYRAGKWSNILMRDKSDRDLSALEKGKQIEPFGIQYIQYMNRTFGYLFQHCHFYLVIALKNPEVTNTCIY